MPAPDPRSPTLMGRLEELERSACARPIFAELERLIVSGSDADCYKINAFRVAERCGVSRSLTLRGLLFATRLGILDLNYDIYCPSCRGVARYDEHLSGLDGKAHCNLCQMDCRAEFLEQVEVTFTVNPDLRRLDVVDFKDRDVESQVDYIRQFIGREERQPLADKICVPGRPATIELELGLGGYAVFVGSHPTSGGLIQARGPRAAEAQRFSITAARDGSVSPKQIVAQPGPIAIDVAFDYVKTWPVIVRPEGPPKNWVSAAFVTSQQDFRDLFAGEFLSAGISFAIQNTTLMFTDIRASTELYEELGDSAAYALVQEHFGIMTEAVRAHAGGIVKTIGDAVMAAFPINVEAVACADAIQQAFGRTLLMGRRVDVKIGLHRGPTIAVTTNRTLDYFGRTVNIAARVQGKSAPGEILMSAAVTSDPAVSAWLAERVIATSARTAELKGIGESFALLAILPRG